MIQNTNHGGRTIVSGQGFFVLATTNAAQLIFNESAKVSTQVPVNLANNLLPALMMSTTAEKIASDQHLRLQMAKDTVNTDDILIQFNDYAKNTYDVNEDAFYKAGAGKVSLSSFSSDHVSLAINQLPFAVKGQTIPLKVGATTDGAYTMNMLELKGISQFFDIWLVDNYLKDSVNMRYTGTYGFNVSRSDTNTYGSARFKLVISQNQKYAYRLLDFTAEKVKDIRQVQVIWTTQYEENYTHFTVERSTDNGKTFNILGGAAAADLGTYSLLDKDPIVGLNLYRLKQEDVNGAITYSKVVPVAYSGLAGNKFKSNLSIFPNPATSTINLAILNADMNSTTNTYSILITNTAGFVLKKATSAVPYWQGSIDDLMPGAYLVKVLNSKDNSVVGDTKFVKVY